MNHFRERLIHLHHCMHMTWRRIKTLIASDRALTNLYNYSPSDFKEQLHLQHKQADDVYRYLQSTSVKELLTHYKRKHIIPITIIDDIYPQLLLQIYDPPFVLYAKGDITILSNEKRLAIVGTRNPTQTGIKSIYHLIPELIEHNWTIVSGLARGIDTVSHRSTIEEKGKTIAVIASGFDHHYPPENKKLFTEMTESHLILSEYPSHIRPQRWHFPIRNRIISGLSAAVLVIEATDRSGSLITADQALEQGREVFAVPGSILSAQSNGTNRLIQQGAKLILNANDIIEETRYL